MGRRNDRGQTDAWCSRNGWPRRLPAVIALCGGAWGRGGGRFRGAARAAAAIVRRSSSGLAGIRRGTAGAARLRGAAAAPVYPYAAPVYRYGYVPPVAVVPSPYYRPYRYGYRNGPYGGRGYRRVSWTRLRCVCRAGLRRLCRTRLGRAWRPLSRTPLTPAPPGSADATNARTGSNCSQHGHGARFASRVQSVRTCLRDRARLRLSEKPSRAGDWRQTGGL